jgi:hypothetical protein
MLNTCYKVSVRLKVASRKYGGENGAYFDTL